MTDIISLMPEGQLTPPTSPISFPHDMIPENGVPPSPQPVARSRRLKHSKSPLFPSPEYRIPHTSLYQYPSDSSLASAYASHSSNGSPPDSKMFTAVIPPLAAVPPTAPLPPTPPKQGIWEELESQEALEILESHRRSNIHPKVEMVVGIIKDVRAEKDAERHTRGLRRMKGNVGEATGAEISTRAVSTNSSRSTIPNLATDSGLPTPGPTPPSSAKLVTVPHTLHHPKPYHLPVRDLDPSHRNRQEDDWAVQFNDDNGYSDYDDDEDGGIAIEYVDEPQEVFQSDRGRKPTTLEPGRLGVPGIDIPRPDSPFVTDFNFQVISEAVGLPR